jgi:hypothetical protein
MPNAMPGTAAPGIHGPALVLLTSAWNPAIVTTFVPSTSTCATTTSTPQRCVGKRLGVGKYGGASHRADVSDAVHPELPVARAARPRRNLHAVDRELVRAEQLGEIPRVALR